MKDLVVQAGEIKINSNLSEIKKEVLEIAKKYDVAVTVENIKEAKALGTELNKMKASVKKIYDENIKEIMKPIDSFKLEIKEINTILEDARQKLVQGAKVFEDARRLEHKQKLEDFFVFRLKEEKLGSIVNTGVAHLVTLTGLTAGGELNKKSKDDVEAVVSKIKTEALEAQIAKEKQEKEDELRIAKEVEERVEKQRIKDKEELEAKHKKELEDAQKNTAYREPEPEKKETTLFTPPTPEPTEAPIKVKSVYHVTYTFELKATPNVPTEVLLEKVNHLFLKDGATPISATSVEYKD